MTPGSPTRGCRHRRFIISGIGTGGHYFPAIVIARELRERGMDVLFLVRHGFPEESAARRYALETLSIPAQGFYGTSLQNKIMAFIACIRAICRLYGITKGITAVACGGFGALPLIAACVLRRSEYFLFEPNRVPGRATRLFARRAQAVFLGMPAVTRLPGTVVVTGIPLRDEFRTRWRKSVRHARKKHVLVFGGSGGARRLNELALELQHSLPAHYRLTIISGPRDYERVVRDRTQRTRVIPFSHDPWNELRNADVVVSRSGALAGYEILASGVPAIFIPYPYAIDDHQWHNARYFTTRGGGMVIRQEEATAARLARAIKELSDRNRHGICPGMDAGHVIADILTGRSL